MIYDWSSCTSNDHHVWTWFAPNNPSWSLSARILTASTRHALAGEGYECRNLHCNRYCINWVTLYPLQSITVSRDFSMRDLRAFVALDGRMGVLGGSELGMDRTLPDVDGGFEVFNALLILQSCIFAAWIPPKPTQRFRLTSRNRRNESVIACLLQVCIVCKITSCVKLSLSVIAVYSENPRTEVLSFSYLPWISDPSRWRMDASTENDWKVPLRWRP